MNERVSALMRAIENDADLRAALEGATSAEQAVQVAAGAGFPVTVADLQEAAAEDASDAELESVGGVVVFSRFEGCTVVK